MARGSTRRAAPRCWLATADRTESRRLACASASRAVGHRRSVRSRRPGCPGRSCSVPPGTYIISPARTGSRHMTASKSCSSSAARSWSTSTPSRTPHNAVAPGAASSTCQASVLPCGAASRRRAVVSSAWQVHRQRPGGVDELPVVGWGRCGRRAVHRASPTRGCPWVSRIVTPRSRRRWRTVPSATFMRSPMRASDHPWL